MISSPAEPKTAPSTARKQRVAFVVQRCGLEVNGGAEAHCLQMAQRMAAHWDTEVLTTCALDYMTWDNFYPAGVEQIGSTTVRRFPVDRPREKEQFDRLSARLHSNIAAASLDEQKEWMRAQGPMSTPLFEFVRANKDAYDAYIFFGYLYATTYFGLPLVREKAYLAPLAHDEWPIYFSMWDELFAQPRQFIFNTAAEKRFVEARFPRLTFPGRVVGLGIEPPGATDPHGFRSRYDLDWPFLLYVGRIDEAKGCATMIDYFLRSRADGATEHKLVLAGTEVMPLPFDDDIIHLGFIGEQEKWDAMAAADWLIMPSPHESLSMALLEAWAAGRPSIVNGRCEVLREHCERSNGGLWYEGYEEWAAILQTVGDEQKDALGRQGMAYVARNYRWERVEQDYLELVKADAAALSRPHRA